MQTVERCTAKAKGTGQRCKNKPVPGFTVCRFHGAYGGAPKGNKNALKTGEYETIWKDQLTEEEEALAASVELDVTAQLEEQILLSIIRLRRMLNRQAKLKDRQMVLVSRREGNEGQKEIYVEESQNVEEMLLKLDEAITRVQDNIVKSLEKLHRIQNETSAADTSTLDSLVAALGLKPNG